MDEPHLQQGDGMNLREVQGAGHIDRAGTDLQGPIGVEQEGVEPEQLQVHGGGDGEGSGPVGEVAGLQEPLGRVGLEHVDGPELVESADRPQDQPPPARHLVRPFEELRRALQVAETLEPTEHLERLALGLGQIEADRRLDRPLGQYLGVAVTEVSRGHVGSQRVDPGQEDRVVRLATEAGGFREMFVGEGPLGGGVGGAGQGQVQAGAPCARRGRRAEETQGLGGHVEGAVEFGGQCQHLGQRLGQLGAEVVIVDGQGARPFEKALGHDEGATGRRSSSGGEEMGGGRPLVTRGDPQFGGQSGPVVVLSTLRQHMGGAASERHARRREEGPDDGIAA